MVIFFGPNKIAKEPFANNSSRWPGMASGQTSGLV